MYGIREIKNMNSNPQEFMGKVVAPECTKEEILEEIEKIRKSAKASMRIYQSSILRELSFEGSLSMASIEGYNRHHAVNTEMWALAEKIKNNLQES